MTAYSTIGSRLAKILIEIDSDVTKLGALGNFLHRRVHEYFQSNRRMPTTGRSGVQCW